MTGSVINCLVNEQRYSGGVSATAVSVAGGAGGTGDGGFTVFSGDGAAVVLVAVAAAFDAFLVAFADVFAVDEDG